MAWVFLIVAGLFEVVWAMAMKYSEGFSRLWPTVITIAGMIVSFYFLSLALKSLPIGSAYAIWTGIGALGTVIFGMVFLGEPRHTMKLVFSALLIISIIGLKVSSGSTEQGEADTKTVAVQQTERM
ncbi:quaternary ammonium compound efflux SMR transporter SugE [Brevibacillus fluminis]|uniref:Quaternary ammonium compound efflux SMR transporter SugE n=1 Tax=Brevibacillus fluminis TaxID=511487 RepID=A0A3M8DS24_9BACL|nr:quaternary ammonium compound efflux SMR transporter SugE [Brevibacillus fluminis]RNB90694.1 quaternary ammonium compound efflux SMR transporter SugE [Brevibacillus fluminis]